MGDINFNSLFYLTQVIQSSMLSSQMCLLGTEQDNIEVYCVCLILLEHFGIRSTEIYFTYVYKMSCVPYLIALTTYSTL